MLEALVAATATTGLFALARHARDEVLVVDPRLMANLGGSSGDLPCPWCFAPTAETDERCPRCDRRFG